MNIEEGYRTTKTTELTLSILISSIDYYFILYFIPFHTQNRSMIRNKTQTE